jgi:hypothetical protein
MTKPKLDLSDLYALAREAGYTGKPESPKKAAPKRLLEPPPKPKSLAERAKRRALVLFWLETECSCGAAYSGPRYTTPLVEWVRPTGAAELVPASSWEHSLPLPFEVRTERRTTLCCPACFRPTPPGQLKLGLREPLGAVSHLRFAEDRYYRRLLKQDEAMPDGLPLPLSEPEARLLLEPTEENFDHYLSTALGAHLSHSDEADED